MGIALIIVGGCVLATLFASMFDYLGKRKGKLDKSIDVKVETMEQRLSALESKLLERDGRIRELEGEVSFVTKLIEDKPAQGSGHDAAEAR